MASLGVKVNELFDGLIVSEIGVAAPLALNVELNGWKPKS
jgi:hypothetical protein